MENAQLYDIPCHKGLRSVYMRRVSTGPVLVFRFPWYCNAGELQPVLASERLMSCEEVKEECLTAE